MNSKNTMRVILIALIITLLFLLYDTTNRLNTYEPYKQEEITTTADNNIKTTTIVANMKASGDGFPSFIFPSFIFPSHDSLFAVEINWWVMLSVFMISCLVLFFAQHCCVNSNATVRYLNTQLQLADFETKVKLFGKKWTIAEDTTLQLREDRVVFILPVRQNFERFGLVKKEHYVQTSTHISRIGPKLQLLRMYLEN